MINQLKGTAMKAYPVASGAINILAGGHAKTAPSHRIWSAPEPEG
jgi:hypothetical protein